MKDDSKTIKAARSRAWYWNGGVMLEQHKDPILSQELVRFIAPDRVRRIRDLEPWREDEEIDTEAIVQVARLARIVDERDGVPLFRKLRKCMGRRPSVLVDALDEEPYISSQLGPMLHRNRECVSGLKLACKAVDASEATILVYQGITDLEVKIPRSVGGFPIQRVRGKYPSELLSAQSLVEEDDHISLYIGACALIHLHRAV